MKAAATQWPPALVPGLILVILSLPCFGFPFLWDDFDFLGRAADFRLGELLPDPQTIYYRPISREVYFGLLTLTGPSPLVGHVLNAAALVGVVVLLFLAMRDLAGQRAGLLSALFFSGMGALPLLVGWISGIQDVLAMLFVMGALVAELRGRAVMALVLAAGGLLCKETAVAVIPALVFAAYIRDSRKRTVFQRSALYGPLVVAWLAVHPAVRIALSGVSGGAEDPLASSTGGSAHSVLSGVLAMLNIPLGSGSLAGFRPLAVAGIIGLAAAPIACIRLGGRLKRDPLPRARRIQVAVLGALIAIPTLLLTALVPRVWSPYYACFPAIGVALIGGCSLAAPPTRVACLAVAAYFLLGIWSRTAALDPTISTESNLRRTGAALDKVERGFRALRASFPSDSYAYVSAQLGGPTGVYRILYRFQPLRIWYHEPSLFVLDPNRYRAGARDEFLFWIDRDFNVYEIDLKTGEPRAGNSDAPPPSAFAYAKTLRTFALGRAAGGQVLDAVRILLTIPGRPVEVQIYDRRTAAALLLATGHELEAQRLLQGVPAFPRPESMEAVFAVLAESVPGLNLDSPAMQAFGIDPRDLQANRMLMQAFDEARYGDPARRFALRVLSLAPGDAEGRRVLARWSRLMPRQITVPIPHDPLPVP